MFGWWKTRAETPRDDGPSEDPIGMLDSKIPIRSSGEVHPSLGEFTGLRLKTEIKRNQCSHVLGTSLGTTEVTTKPTTAPTTKRSSVERSVEEVNNLFDLNWNWVLQKPATQIFDHDVVRVWSVNAPPAQRQPTAREHAIELFQLLQREPRLVGKWILATDLERSVYPQLLACLGWAPRPWVGRSGVAKHLGDLTLRRYRRVEVAGSKHNWAAFFVPTGRKVSGLYGPHPSRRARTKRRTALESFIAAWEANQGQS